MPLYDFHCQCKKKVTLYSTVAERNNPRSCSCGATLERQEIYAPYVIPDIGEYQSPVTGRPITSRSKRIEDLKQANAIPWEPGMNETLAKTRQQDEAQTQAKFETYVEQTAGELRASGRI